MCRWLAYSGSPILIRDVLYEGPNSLVGQSLHSQLGAEPTNGDGFGVGWYGDARHAGRLPQHRAGLERQQPARARRPHQLAAVLHPHPGGDRQRRAADATATPSATTAGCSCTTATSTSSHTIKRDLILAVDPSLYPEIKGQADTEVLFYLALTFGLEDDPPAAVEQAIGLVEAVAARHGVPNPFQGTVATTDGETIWAFRYSSERNSRSLFYTTDVPTLRELYPERQLFQEVSDNARLIVSEPLGDVAGVWNEVPESTYGIVGPGRAEMRPFEPKAPASPGQPVITQIR